MRWILLTMLWRLSHATKQSKFLWRHISSFFKRTHRGPESVEWPLQTHRAKPRLWAVCCQSCSGFSTPHCLSISHLSGLDGRTDGATSKLKNWNLVLQLAPMAYQIGLASLLSFPQPFCLWQTFSPPRFPWSLCKVIKVQACFTVFHYLDGLRCGLMQLEQCGIPWTVVELWQVHVCFRLEAQAENRNKKIDFFKM